MKLASIEPFVGTPETDIERELAAESVRVAAESVTSVNGGMVEGEISGSNSDRSRGGFERLVDFLKKDKGQREAYHSQSMKVRRAYQYLDDADQASESLGLEVDRVA